MTTSKGRFIVLLSAVALGGVNAGCSFIFVEGLPSDHAKLSYFDCTSTYGLSVADGVIALSGGVGAETALSQSKQAYADKNSGASRNAAAGVDIALAGVLAASAVYGVVQATRCDRAKEELRARIFESPLRPPPPPGSLPGTGPAALPPPAPSAAGPSLPPPPVPGPPSSVPEAPVLAPAAPTP
jgi:hypothetical protein